MEQTEELSRSLSARLTRRATPAIFALTIILSAFLLFQIQPMIGKFILPWFGGSSAVWTTSMLFFQVLLLGGYAYAHFLGTLPPRRQSGLHLLVLLLVLGWIALAAWLNGTPVTPDPRLKPAGSAFPVWQILIVLAASVGIPYFLLSTSSSLFQAWYRDVHRRSSPYAFYALSNAASLVALLSYPVLFEPALTLQQQAAFWSVGFAVYLLLAGLCAVILRGQAAARPVENYAAGESASLPETAPAETPARPGPGSYLVWAGLAACASVLLLATTNHITQDLTSTPFLWVLPLGLYLLSFVFAFNDRQAGLRGAYVLLTLAVLLVGYLVLDQGSSMPIFHQIAANAVLLFVICLLCHSELYARRPHPRYLTNFYLMVSVGGALGGLLVSIVAPLVFRDYWEYQLGLVASALVAVVIAFQSRGSWLYRLRFPVALAAVILAGFILYTSYYWIATTQEMTRSFYGVLRVRGFQEDEISGFRLLHGGILHGTQVREEPFRYQPTSYYTESSGVGVALKSHPRYRAGEPLRIGVVGLGVGTMAAYGRAGDTIRFYEINPQVVQLARDSGYFTYLTDTPAAVEIVIGDARLSMERELAAGEPQGYQLLVVDAFSGDSIPIHLINREALQTYLAHLADDGILAFHISNRHIDLQPVVALLAEAYDLEAALIQGGSDDMQGSYSVWALLGSRETMRGMPEIAARRAELNTNPGLRIWTDDYSNLYQVLRR